MSGSKHRWDQSRCMVFKPDPSDLVSDNSVCGHSCLMDCWHSVAIPCRWCGGSTKSNWVPGYIIQSESPCRGKGSDSSDMCYKCCLSYFHIVLYLLRLRPIRKADMEPGYEKKLYKTGICWSIHKFLVGIPDVIQLWLEVLSDMTTTSADEVNRSYQCTIMVKLGYYVPWTSLISST